ncbi:hypothetical protein [Sedimentitalea sp.]|uniref:hypothetical protein n=1 Tax=Sedimentitalea sp. TaxID=2048915 RepID=UPI0032990A28
MDDNYPEWVTETAEFLSENLPRATDRPGWNDMASTAFQIGCMSMVKLGFADKTAWGAIPKDHPKRPEMLPRWDDICISVLWLANQQSKLSYRLPDGSAPPSRIGNGFVIVRKDAPPPPTPNIAARFGLGPALAEPEVEQLLDQLGLVADGAWTKEAVFVLWRTSPKNWAVDYASDSRFLDAVEKAVASVPDEVASEISKLIVITDDDIDALINRHAEMIDEAREKYGPKARLGEVPSQEQARRSIEFSRRDEMDWLFFRRWRIDDGWLSDKETSRAIEIFHDRLAISMRKTLLRRLHPTKPSFFE